MHHQQTDKEVFLEELFSGNVLGVDLIRQQLRLSLYFVISQLRILCLEFPHFYVELSVTPSSIVYYKSAESYIELLTF
jgi:hypothetical protein